MIFHRSLDAAHARAEASFARAAAGLGALQVRSVLAIVRLASFFIKSSAGILVGFLDHSLLARTRCK